MVFDFIKAENATAVIKLESEGKGRKHPKFRFFDSHGNYIFEVHYGDAATNALQRGLWTNTKNVIPYFNSATNGWIDYSDNTILVKLFSYALVSTAKGHHEALNCLLEDIKEEKTNMNGL